MPKRAILVSACLAGQNCKYNGGNNLDPEIHELVRQGSAIPICPECLGKLPIPRPPAEIQGGNGLDVLSGKAKVLDCEGKDVTQAFLEGAWAVLAQAERLNPSLIILKEKSPSCGTTLIYDGSFSGRTRPGPGVTAALLRQQHFTLRSERNWKE
ncbi:MAG: DUF523 domain-containing protein [Clostridia bacterium]|nr:DUF523 domain-containing protein [Clostridia bacterium]